MEYNRYDEKDDSRGCTSAWCGLSSQQEHFAGVQRGYSNDQEVTLTFEQPRAVPPPAFEPQNHRPVTASSQSRTKSWFSNDRARSSDFTRSRASRSSSITTLVRPWTSQSKRPSISAPMNFRRVTEPMPPMPTRRRSFRPLELSIYLPQRSISPLPDFRLGGDWEDKLEQLKRPQAAVVRRETLDNSELPGDYMVRRKPLSAITYNPLRRAVLSEPFVLAAENGPGPTLETATEIDHRISDLARIDENRTPTLTLNQIEEMAAPSRPWSSRSSMRSPSPFGNRSRSNTDLAIPRKPSLRRSKTDVIDDAIRELNTIVEEKRVKAIQGARANPFTIPSSPTIHVPAIAPRMQVRARTETLSSIGSAFSVAIPKPLPAAPIPNYATSPIPVSAGRGGLTVITSPHSSISSMGTAMVRIPPANYQYGAPRVSAKSRLSTWLRRSLPGSPVSPTAPQQPFYQLTPTTTPAGFDSRPKRSTSVSTFSSVSSTGSSTSATFSDSTYVTPTTTVASPTTPGEDMSLPPPRPSISKTPKTLRRVATLKRGLSIDTTLSSGSGATNVPPAYQVEDPHPLSPLESPITPNRVGLAY